MKKTIYVVILFTLLHLTAFAQEAQSVIQLNEHSTERGINVMKTFQNRQSISKFQNKELNLQDLSDLLWAANGINRPEVGKKTAPSAQNSQDVDIYVALKSAVYLYDAKDNILKLVSEGDFRGLAGDKVIPPCVLFIAADKMKYKAGNDSSHVADMNRVDAGIVSQNISIFCAGTGLATKPRAGMKQDELRNVLKLTDGQTLLLNHPVGYPEK